MLPLAHFVAREVARYPAAGARRSPKAPREAPAGPGLLARLRDLMHPRAGAAARRAP